MPKVIPQYKQQATNKILEAARVTFAEKGYHEARMEDIAERVGVSKRTLYLYFKNKEELFTAICAEAPQTLQAVFSSMTADIQNMRDLERFMEDLFDKLLEQEFAGPGPASIGGIMLNYEMVLAAARNPSLKKIVRESNEKEMDILVGAIRKLKEKSRDESLEPAVLARALFAMYPGLIADVIIGADKSEVRKTWVESIRALFNKPSTKK